MSEPYHSHDEEEEEDQDQEQQFDPNDIVEVIEFGDDDDAPMDEDDEEGGLEMVREDEEGDERMEEDEQPVEDNSLGHSRESCSLLGEHMSRCPASISVAGRLPGASVNAGTSKCQRQYIRTRGGFMNSH